MASARQAFSLLDPTSIRPTAIVLGVIIALWVGAQLVNAVIPARTGTAGPGSGPISGPGGPGQPTATLPPIALPTQDPGTGGPLPPGSVLTAGPLRIPLEPGWQTASGNQNVVASLVKGSVQIDLVSLSVTGGTASATGIYDGYMGIISGSASTFSSAPASNIQIGGGLAAARGSYTGIFGPNQVEGEVTAFVTGTTDGWVWDVWGPSGTVSALLPEAQRMINNIQVQ